jgi:hypothetical protein
VEQSRDLGLEPRREVGFGELFHVLPDRRGVPGPAAVGDDGGPDRLGVGASKNRPVTSSATVSR